MRSYFCSKLGYPPPCSRRPTRFATWLCGSTRSFSVFLLLKKNSVWSPVNRARGSLTLPEADTSVRRPPLSAAVGVAVDSRFDLGVPPRLQENPNSNAKNQSQTNCKINFNPLFKSVRPTWPGYHGGNVLEQINRSPVRAGHAWFCRFRIAGHAKGSGFCRGIQGRHARQTSPAIQRRIARAVAAPSESPRIQRTHPSVGSCTPRRPRAQECRCADGRPVTSGANLFPSADFKLSGRSDSTGCHREPLSGSQYRDPWSLARLLRARRAIRFVECVHAFRTRDLCNCGDGRSLWSLPSVHQ